MASGGQSDNVVINESEEGQAPLWKYVTKLEKIGAKGGTWKFWCGICNETRQGSYSRIRAHLLGITKSGIAICNKATRTERLEMKRLEEEFEKKKSESGRREVPLACEAESSSKKRRSCTAPIIAAFGIQARDQLDQEIARMFYNGGLPFNLARNPHYQRSYQYAAASKLDGYVAPGYNKIRTTLSKKSD